MHQDSTAFVSGPMCITSMSNGSDDDGSLVFVDEIQYPIRASSRQPYRVKRRSKRFSNLSWLSDQDLSKETKDSYPNLGWQ